jgi:hypothetical protein
VAGSVLIGVGHDILLHVVRKDNSLRFMGRVRSGRRSRGSKAECNERKRAELHVGSEPP